MEHKPGAEIVFILVGTDQAAIVITQVLYLETDAPDRFLFVIREGVGRNDPVVFLPNLFDEFLEPLWIVTVSYTHLTLPTN